MIRLVLGLLLALFVALPAQAQQNCPRTPAVGNKSTTCANTAFVDDAIHNLPSIANSSVLGNFSGGSAAPSAQSVPACANDGLHALTNNGSGGFNCTPIAPATSQSIQATNHTFTSADCGIFTRRFADTGSAMVDTLPTGPLLPAGCVLYIENVDDSHQLYAIQTTDLLDVAKFLILGPYQSAVIQTDGTHYWTTSKPVRAKLFPGTSVSLYYTGGTCSNNNVGVDSADPWCDQQQCWNYVQANFDVGNNKGGTGVVCQQLDSTVTQSNSQGGPTAALNAQGDIPGHNAVIGVTFQGNCAAPGNTVWHPSAGSIAIFDDYANAVLTCMTVQIGTANAPVFIAQHHGFAVIADKVTITGGAATGDLMRAQDEGHILQQGTLTITGGSGGAIGSAQMHSLMEVGGTIALSGTTNFAETYAVGDSSSIAATPSYTGTGGATITNKYVLANGGFLNTGGNCVSVPGTGTSVDGFSNCH